MAFSQSRRQIMQSIRGKGNKTTEMRMVAIFRELGITGWRRHQKLPGKPDFVFRKSKVAVFVDGCFWHGCPRCYQAPQTRSEFWRNKVETNQRRDRRVSRQLRDMGWSVHRFWECRLKDSCLVWNRLHGLFQAGEIKVVS
ncbi:MAG: very short patch repair endonuclease [Limisphaerales bacterium]